MADDPDDPFDLDAFVKNGIPGFNPEQLPRKPHVNGGGDAEPDIDDEADPPPNHGEGVKAGDDARPRERAPYSDAPITPIMRLLDEKLSTNEHEPPMRNIMGQMAMVRVRKPRHQSLHELAPEGSETLDAPIMPLLTEHDETSLSILIERHINFEKVVNTKKHGENKIPVSLCPAFVRHYHRYADSTLPVAHAIATMPLVLPNGKLIAPRGLDRDLGIIFRIDPKLAAILPRPGGVTRGDVRAKMKFLLDEWLVDVTAAIPSKCVLIAMALTILERTVLLSGRPGFFITAAKRGGGKTTAAHMVSVAALGVHAIAAAWSPAEEERRKAMLAYLSEGVPFLVFDNILAGATISSAVIEAMLTSGECSDRVLGMTKTLHTATSTIVTLTGNNVSPCGDLSSRCLIARIDVDRPDPEHREFTHPYPLEWTAANRGKILAALYTVMLGDSEIGKPLDPAAQHTRFREWEMIIGRPVEHAAAALGEKVCFAEMLTATEAEDETAMSNIEVLLALSRQWPGGLIFEAADISEYCKFLGDAPPADVALLRDYFDPRVKPGEAVSPKKIGKALRVLLGSPFLAGNGDGTIKLVSGGADKHSKTNGYKIERKYSNGAEVGQA
jgi:hypothetical protein